MVLSPWKESLRAPTWQSITQVGYEVQAASYEEDRLERLWVSASTYEIYLAGNGLLWGRWPWQPMVCNGRWRRWPVGARTTSPQTAPCAYGGRASMSPWWGSAWRLWRRGFGGSALEGGKGEPPLRIEELGIRR